LARAKPRSGANEASLHVKVEHEQTIGTELPERGELGYADPLAGAGSPLRGVTVDALLAGEGDSGVIFPPPLANSHRQPLADPGPLRGVEDAIDKQHAAETPRGNDLALMRGL
jgi:hypothetical protein